MLFLAHCMVNVNNDDAPKEVDPVERRMKIRDNAL